MDEFDVYEHARERIANRCHAAWAAELLIYPAEWDKQASHVANGQHRICALKFAQVDRAVVFTGT